MRMFQLQDFEIKGKFIHTNLLFRLNCLRPWLNNIQLSLKIAGHLQIPGFDDLVQFSSFMFSLAELHLILMNNL